MLSKNYVLQTAKTILQQIVAGVDNISIFYSWGPYNFRPVVQHCIIDDSNIDFAGLRFTVNARVFVGDVAVILDDCKDTYIVYLYGPDNSSIIHKVDDVYCDELGRLIDELVEYPAGTDAGEYHRQAINDLITSI
jgi:hypothetical protein